MIDALKSVASSALGAGPQIAERSGASTSTGADFAVHLAETIRAGERAAIAGVNGEMPMQKVIETVMDAERTLTTAVSIRDKLVSAYLEISRMQI